MKTPGGFKQSRLIFVGFGKDGEPVQLGLKENSLKIVNGFKEDFFLRH